MASPPSYPCLLKNKQGDISILCCNPNHEMKMVCGLCGSVGDPNTPGTWAQHHAGKGSKRKCTAGDKPKSINSINYPGSQYIALHNLTGWQDVPFAEEKKSKSKKKKQKKQKTGEGAFLVSYCTVRYGTVRYGMVRYCTVWYCTVFLYVFVICTSNCM